MTILYTNGCSYTANLELESDRRYPTIVSNHFGWELVDRSIPGSCNSKIIRSAMKDCIRLMQTQQPIVALIQLTHHNRIEYAGTPTQSNCWKYSLDLTDPNKFDLQAHDLFESINPLDEPNWPSEATGYFKQAFVLQKDPAVFNNLFHGVIGLTSFFQKHDIQYRIYAGPSYEGFEFQSDPFYQYLKNDPGVLDLDKFCMLRLTETNWDPGSRRHPNADGMRSIADYFINLLDEPK